MKRQRRNKEGIRKKMFCINCGSQIDDDSLFCPICGERTDLSEQDAPTTVIGASPAPAAGAPTTTLGGAQQGETRQMPPSPASPQGVQGTYGPQGGGFQPVTLAEDYGRQTTQRGGRGAVMALVVILVLAVLGVGGFFGGRALGLFGSDDQPSASSHSHSRDDDDADEGDEGGTDDGDTDADDEPSAATPATIAVPDVVGMSESDAMHALNGAGFGIGSISYAESSDRPLGEVISQSPAASTQMEEGAIVDLVLSPGPSAKPHTYTVVAQAMTWQEANSYCQSHGGHLVTITSAEEYEQVLDAISGYSQQVFWIGYYRMGTDGSFGWVTGEPSSYTAWASGEPNDEDGIEDYAAIFSLSDGSVGWYDVPNDLSEYYRDTKLAFVMETE